MRDGAAAIELDGLRSTRAVDAVNAMNRARTSLAQLLAGLAPEGERT
jgi:hypothetical protein